MNTHQLTRIGLGLSLMILSAQLTLPIGPVPITMQSLVVLIIVFYFNFKDALIVLLLYLLLGIMGLPLFAGYKGGIAMVLSPSFGFLVSFALLPLLAFLLKKSFLALWGQVLLASGFIYLIGITYFYLLSNYYLGKSLDVTYLLQILLLPFLPGDITKALVAMMILQRLDRNSFNQDD